MPFRPGLRIGLTCLQDFLNSFSESWEIVPLRLSNLGDSLCDSYMSTKLRLVDLLDEGLLVVRSYITSVLVLGLVLQAVVWSSEHDAFLPFFVVVFWILCLGCKAVVQILYCVDRVVFLTAVSVVFAAEPPLPDLRLAPIQVCVGIVGFLLQQVVYRPVGSLLKQRR